MEVRLESLLPFEKISADVDAVFELVEKNGNVVLLKDNQPMYIIMKYEAALGTLEKKAEKETLKYTLQEAMRIVLSEAVDNKMHASALADEIFNRRLYLQKNGEKAQYNQIRARCGHYPDMFEALPGNVIRLKSGEK